MIPPRFAVATILMMAWDIFAQQAGTIDTSFNSGSMLPVTPVSCSVYASAILPDNKILLGGSFQKISNISRPWIARVNPTGTVDTTFDASAILNQAVAAIVSQPDGKILVGGSFTLVNGVCNRLIRLTYDGLPDMKFAIGTGADKDVTTIVLQPDGGIVVGGSFSNFNGVACAGMVRLNRDGAIDPGFIRPSFFGSYSPGPGPNVFCAALQSDQKILVGGGFTNVAGSGHSEFVRLNTNGSVDSGFASTVSASYAGPSYVRAVAVQDDGKILVTGKFDRVNGIARTNVARLLIDGSVDPDFNPGTGPNGIVYTVTLQVDGKFLIGGGFNTYNGTSAPTICRLNFDGTRDPTFQPNFPTGSMTSMNTINVQNDGKILAGGLFSFYFSSPLRTNALRLIGITNLQSAPVIVSPPQDQSVEAGEPVAMQVATKGNPLSFQWYFNGNPFTNATNAVLYFPSATATNSGSYSVIVSNILGSVTSDSAILSVTNGLPFFVVEPTDVTTNAGKNVTLLGLARGLPDYQWSLNGTALPSQTNALCTLSNVVGSNSGSYSVVASNSSGTVTSHVVTLSVVEAAPSISSQPTNQQVLYDGFAMFSVTASGAPTPSFQWKKNGTNIAGATGNSCTISPAKTDDAGSYTVVITNYLNAITSQVAILTVDLPVALSGTWYTNVTNWISAGQVPWIVETTTTQDGTDALESAASLTSGQQTYVEAQVVGPGLLTFWWKVSSLSGFDYLKFSTNSAMQAQIAGEVDWQQKQFNLASGTQTLRWAYVKGAGSSGGQNKAWLDHVSFALPTNVVIVAGPTNQSVLQRGYTTLNVEISSATTVGYQWRFNDTNDISGATNSTLTLTNFQPAQAGSYSVMVTNNISSAISTNAGLTMRPIVESSALIPLWQKLPGSISWIPDEGNTTNYSYRGLAYNPVTKNVLVISRAEGTNVYVLNSQTGDEIRTLKTSGINGGVNSLNMIGVADDGAVYSGNLVTDSRTDPFRLYRWPSDATDAEPALVWQGDPANGSGSTRWGDSLDVRGSGSSVQVLLGSGANSSKAQAALITPANGTNAPALNLTLSTSFPDYAFNITAMFGDGSTLWSKGIGTLLKHYDFDPLGNITGSNSFLMSAINAPLFGVNNADRKLAVLSLDSPDHIRLYDFTGFPNKLLELDAEFFVFPIDYPNSFATGSIRFGENRVYALDSHNGILALKLAPTIHVQQNAGSVILTWTGNYTLQFASEINGSYGDIVGATSPYVFQAAQHGFYRLRE